MPDSELSVKASRGTPGPGPGSGHQGTSAPAMSSQGPWSDGGGRGQEKRPQQLRSLCTSAGPARGEPHRWVPGDDSVRAPPAPLTAGAGAGCPLPPPHAKRGRPGGVPGLSDGFPAWSENTETLLLPSVHFSKIMIRSKLGNSKDGIWEASPHPSGRTSQGGAQLSLTGWSGTSAAALGTGLSHLTRQGTLDRGPGGTM